MISADTADLVQSLLDSGGGGGGCVARQHACQRSASEMAIHEVRDSPSTVRASAC
jgi:hypothetical protein